MATLESDAAQVELTLKPVTELAGCFDPEDIAFNPLDGISNRKAERILVERAFSRMLASDTAADERTFALIFACCMVSKITFEKFFSRIKKAVAPKRRDNKKQNKSKKKKTLGKGKKDE